MRFWLGPYWSYAASVQSTGPWSWTLMLIAAPPGHAAPVHAANASVAAVTASPYETLLLGLASFCTSKLTQLAFHQTTRSFRPLPAHVLAQPAGSQLPEAGW